VFRFLPTSLQRLYRRLIDAVPYARKTRPRPLPPDDEAPGSGQARHYRLEIAYDAFCEHRPPPKKLFRATPWRRDLTSWCDAPNSWTDRREPRCHHCETARAHYIAACRGDWKAEVALYKLARRGAVRLLAERRQYRESRRQFWARHREHVARNGPEPMPPQFEPELWPMIAHRGSVESWHHRDRRAVERGLVRAHARHIRRQTQLRRERLRDLEAAAPVGRKRAQRALHQTDAAEAASPPEPRHCEDPGAAGVRGNPGQRDKRVRRGPGSPRRQTAAREDDVRGTRPSGSTADAASHPDPSWDADGVHGTALAEPTADPAPPPDAPATPRTTDGDELAPARFPRRRPTPPDIKIGAARPTIPGVPVSGVPRSSATTGHRRNTPSGYTPAGFRRSMPRGMTVHVRPTAEPREHAARLPNFFILGAPKCGTTPMAAWLGQHPGVFIPATKEPHFFNTDDTQDVATLDAYERLFAGATAAHGAIGEASVWYLSSAVAVANILRHQPDARFIVMLRNPVDMAPALHAEMLISGQENVRDFRAAWSLQDDRRHGRRVPALSRGRRRFVYADVCALGTQLQRLLAAVPRERVLTILLDDVIADPRGQYVRALRFLGVDDDGRADFPAYNRARAIRWPALTRALFLAIRIKDRMGIRLNAGVWGRVADWNVVESPRDTLPPDTSDMLRRHFADEVALLGRQLDRDLQHWLRPEPRAG